MAGEEHARFDLLKQKVTNTKNTKRGVTTLINMTDDSITSAARGVTLATGSLSASRFKYLNDMVTMSTDDLTQKRMEQNKVFIAVIEASWNKETQGENRDQQK